MFKKEGSETFIITFIFLAIGFLIKDLTGWQISIAKIGFLGFATVFDNYTF